ncbi:hypothetical protein [Halorubrum sp. DTA98]|uniref:hypothetical protein n=1 Tax=Halorubrum sp. DTA98 TaxID=3402163 RepID=UPI003AADC087
MVDDDRSNDAAAPRGDGDRPDGGRIPDGDVIEAIESTTLAVAREELTTTFEYQVQRLREIDNKAIEILKANLLLIGIVVTGGSVLVQTELPVAVLVNAFTVTGGLLLLVSTGLASVTYTSSNLRGGLDADAVEAAIDADIAERGGRQPDPTFEERLLRSYARWISYNARMIAVNDILVTVTVLLVFVAFVYVVAGVIAAALDPTFLVSAAAFVLVSIVMSSFTWIAYHMDHIGPEPDHLSGTFRGVRLSKGASRRRGLSTLRDMLGRSPSDPDDSEE